MRIIKKNGYYKKTTQRAGIIYYSYTDAYKLIEDLEEKGIRLLGIDSYKLTRFSTQPYLEHSIDLSEKQNAYEIAKIFLKEKEELCFLYEIVY